MKRRELLTGLAATALASGCTSQAPSKAQTSQARYGSPVPLPSPVTTDTISLEKAIGKRRAMRAFRPDPLPTATIGQLLWAGQGVTSPDGKRAAPSAGALYPLELYAVTRKQVTGGGHPRPALRSDRLVLDPGRPRPLTDRPQAPAGQGADQGVPLVRPPARAAIVGQY